MFEQQKILKANIFYGVNGNFMKHEAEELNMFEDESK